MDEALNSNLVKVFNSLQTLPDFIVFIVSPKLFVIVSQNSLVSILMETLLNRETVGCKAD